MNMLLAFSTLNKIFITRFVMEFCINVPKIFIFLSKKKSMVIANDEIRAKLTQHNQSGLPSYETS